MLKHARLNIFARLDSDPRRERVKSRSCGAKNAPLDGATMVFFEKTYNKAYRIFRLQNSLHPMYVYIRGSNRGKKCCRRRIAVTVSTQTKLNISPRSSSAIFTTLENSSFLLPFFLDRRISSSLPLFRRNENGSEKREYSSFELRRGSKFWP